MSHEELLTANRTNQNKHPLQCFFKYFVHFPLKTLLSIFNPLVFDKANVGFKSLKLIYVRITYN